MDNDRSNPKFCSGEMAIATNTRGERNRVEVIRAYYCDCAWSNTLKAHYTGWAYLLSDSATKEDYTAEYNLEKIPDDNPLTWDKLKTKLKAQSPLNRKENT